MLQRPVEPAQFRSALFQDALTTHGLIGSMGQVGAAGDNAAMESFFALLQKNVLDRRDWDTRDELRAGACQLVCVSGVVTGRG